MIHNLWFVLLYNTSGHILYSWITSLQIKVFLAIVIFIIVYITIIIVSIIIIFMILHIVQCTYRNLHHHHWGAGSSHQIEAATKWASVGLLPNHWSPRLPNQTTLTPLSKYTFLKIYSFWEIFSDRNIYSEKYILSGIYFQKYMLRKNIFILGYIFRNMYAQKNIFWSPRPLSCLLDIKICLQNFIKLYSANTVAKYIIWKIYSQKNILKNIGFTDRGSPFSCLMIICQNTFVKIFSYKKYSWSRWYSLEKDPF